MIEKRKRAQRSRCSGPDAVSKGVSRKTRHRRRRYWKTRLRPLGLVGYGQALREINDPHRARLERFTNRLRTTTGFARIVGTVQPAAAPRAVRCLRLGGQLIIDADQEQEKLWIG